MHDGVGEQGHERGLHVRPHDQGDAGRQQRDVVAGDQRIELDRTLAQDDLGQRREAVGVGVRLRREVHQADVRHAQELLDLVGIRRDDEDGGIGRARDERARRRPSRSSSMKVAFSFSMTPLASSSCLAMPREPLSRVPIMMRLPLRSRRVVIGRSPRVKTQTGSWNSRPDRAQLGVLGVPALLLLGGQAPLQAADQAAFDEARGDPRTCRRPAPAA